jgi:hypothetical protein
MLLHIARSLSVKSWLVVSTTIAGLSTPAVATGISLDIDSTGMILH